MTDDMIPICVRRQASNDDGGNYKGTSQGTNKVVWLSKRAEGTFITVGTQVDMALVDAFGENGLLLTVYSRRNWKVMLGQAMIWL